MKTLNSIIEISCGSIYKYEADKETGRLILDRPLNQPCPVNYGYLTGTLSSDGDPLDIFLISKQPLYALAVAKAVPVGVFLCEDNGQEDDKIVAVLEGDEIDIYQVVSDTANVERYLRTYKEGFKVLEYKNKDKAIEVYERSVKDYQKHELELQTKFWGKQDR